MKKTLNLITPLRSLIVITSLAGYGCVSLDSIYDDYQPVFNAEQQSSVQKVYVSEVTRPILITLEKPTFVDSNATSAATQGGLLGAFLVGVIDGISDARTKRKIAELSEVFSDFESCIKEWSKTSENSVFPNLSADAIDAWDGKQIVYNQPSGDNSDKELIYETSAEQDGLQIRIMTTRTLNFSYDFSVLSADLSVSIFSNEEPDPDKVAKLEQNPYLKDKTTEEIRRAAQHIERYAILFQKHSSAEGMEGSELNLLCSEKSGLKDVLPEDHLKNFVYWFSNDGKNIVDLISESTSYHSDVMKTRSKNVSDNWVTPTYEQTEFLNFQQIPDSAKKAKRKITLRANQIAQSGSFTVIRKYNGDYYIFETDQKPYSRYSF